ncbi:transcriptional corepressor LEUNIG_HOMOLOG-like isoform X1 [Chenopodium quinoa]|uniref:transcriptional corepressor LEUNIG_HOMOLOG-like isoform X1 n=1 Tax=Chenopodium quinoa TaxID=63459 RepID=UPI000B78CB3B|nr:transcriptional corepressor LEUNIG_HOMOLOG-like isoform X1 [Chenopodium quinoa]
MAQSNWEADKMLDVYIHDYLLKRKLHNSAKAFMAEGKVATDPVAIDAPGGFLFEWWSVFWDIFIARTNEKHSEAAAAYIETQQMKTREQQQQQQQQLQMHQMQLMQQRNAQMQRGGPNHPPLGGPVNGIMDNRMALLKSANNPQGQLIQGNSGGMSAALQQIQARPHMTSDIKSEVSIGGAQKSLPMDPSSIYGQAILQSKSGLGSAGLNPGINSLPLKGWPLTGIDTLRMPQKPLIQNQILLAAQQQQVLSQAQAQNSLGSSPSYGDNDPRRFNGLPKGSMNTKEAQSARNDVCSPMQSSSPQMKMGQMQQSSSQQQDQLQQQQIQQNNRKRKQHSSSGPANSTGTGNTVGPSPNSPPSTHTPGDGIGPANSLQQVNSMPKSLLMYGAEGTGALASSSNQLDDIEQFGDVGSLDDNVESFLSHDGGDGKDLYGSIKQSPAEPKPEPSKGFSFSEVGCIRTRNKVTSCHFSSDGKYLASAGHDKKAVLWNMDTLQTESTPEDHTLVITDVRFRPNSTHLATASFDGSVRLWDASNPSHCMNVYPGRGNHVMSLDFHPKKNDLFCFCDSNSDIHYWSMSPFSCIRMSKGGTAQVRFQPRVGQLLAAASDKVVSIFDVESDRPTHSFQAHSDVVNYICWDASGELLASVSQDSVKVWSLTSGDCIHELCSNGNQFHSCVFHPSFPTLLVVGGTRSLELWNMADNRSMTVPAHDNIVSALTASVTGMVASAGHDCAVKIWK